MDSSRLSAEHLDRLVSSIKDRFGIVMASDPLKARERVSALVRDMSQDLDEKQDRVFAWIMERSDQAFVEIISPYITVGETYFFRDRKTLKSFREGMLPSLASNVKRPIKVWSAGCSTGEEPYTLAMIMEDSTLGLGGGFRVYGTDLNENSLKKAKKGVYGRWSFRGMSDLEIARYFDPFEGGFFQVKERYRSEVSFGSTNLVASILPWHDGEIDVIFCRNVIMYFDDDGRKKVLEGFMDALSPCGWLIVAACETSLLDGSPFHPIHIDGQTFFRPTDPSQGLCPFTSRIWPPSEEPEDPAGENDDYDDDYDYGVTEEEFPTPYSHLIEDPSNKEVEPDTVPSVDIDVIRAMADRGEREKALDLCLSLGNSTDPYVHYLTSIIYQDVGNLADAKERLRKALFLDPSFVMAHYSLLGIAISEGNERERTRNLRNLRGILLEMTDNDVIPHGDGATAKDLLSALANL